MMRINLLVENRMTTATKVDYTPSDTLTVLVVWLLTMLGLGGLVYWKDISR